MSIIEVEKISKNYGSIHAVKEVSFRVEKGEVFGLLGPNGAGKTTMIKILTTLIAPTSGSAKVLSFDVVAERSQITHRIGVVQQNESYDRSLTVEDSMRLYGLLWDVPKSLREKRIDFLLDKFGLTDIRKMRCRDLSFGQRRRLQVAREFIHDMELLFLDEPTISLDPVIRRVILDFIKEKVREGLTILFTTQNMEEARYLCDRIGLIDRGELVTIDSPDGFIKKFGRLHIVRIDVAGHQQELFVRTLRQMEGVEEMKFDPPTGIQMVVSKDPGAFLPELFNSAEKLGLRLSSLTISEPTLEDVFLDLVRRG